MDILFLTTFYPNPLRPGTPVCHYFTKEWKNMGNRILVIHFRSMFPHIFVSMARAFPRLASRYVGNHVELDTNEDIVCFEKDGIPVFSMPIFKYFPHGKYSRKEIKRSISVITGIMKDRGFCPDAIIGHFYNPQLPIIAGLKDLYPEAKTCVSFHESVPSVIDRILPKNRDLLFSKIDIFGFRSLPIKRAFESYFGADRKSFLCYSGTSKAFLNAPALFERCFSDGPIHNFIYVGQFIERKYPKVVVEALNEVYNGEGFELDYVGEKQVAFEGVERYVNDHGLSNRVRFLGKIPREDVISKYDASDCFIMISRDEVFGLVYLEAMARGCITVASKNEGMEGIIENGINGFMCEAGNKEELKSIINTINSMTAEERRSISVKAKETAARLSDYNVAKNYIEAVMNA